LKFLGVVGNAKAVAHRVALFDALADAARGELEAALTAERVHLPNTLEAARDGIGISAWPSRPASQQPKEWRTTEGILPFCID
jgi:hypothetical protein